MSWQLVVAIVVELAVLDVHAAQLDPLLLLGDELCVLGDDEHCLLLVHPGDLLLGLVLASSLEVSWHFSRSGRVSGAYPGHGVVLLFQ